MPAADQDRADEHEQCLDQRDRQPVQAPRRAIALVTASGRPYIEASRRPQPEGAKIASIAPTAHAAEDGISEMDGSPPSAADEEERRAADGHVSA